MPPPTAADSAQLHVFGYTVRAKDEIRDCIIRVIDESDLDRYTAAAKDATWEEANLPGARGLAPNPLTSTTYWVRPVPREQAKVIDLRAAHTALVLAADHLFSREGHSSAYMDAARARDNARDALARYRKTPAPDPATAADKHLAAACREWITGCPCAAPASPQECKECTDAFLAAVLKRAKTHGLEIGIHGI